MPYNSNRFILIKVGLRVAAVRFTKHRNSAVQVAAVLYLLHLDIAVEVAAVLYL